MDKVAMCRNQTEAVRSVRFILSKNRQEKCFLMQNGSGSILTEILFLGILFTLTHCLNLIDVNFFNLVKLYERKQ